MTGPRCRHHALPKPGCNVCKTVAAIRAKGGLAPVERRAPPPPARPPCRHEGPVVTHAGGCCSSEATRQLAHVRHCLYDGADWDTCTRGPNNGAAQACVACPHHDPAPHATLNMGAAGIGDGVQGLLAAAGLKRDDPTLHVAYRVSALARPFVELFGGYDELRDHDWDQGGKRTLATGDAQLNVGYVAEMVTRGRVPRWERYCRNAGASGPVVPPLRDPAAVRRAGADLAGCVALAPFSQYSDREWPLPHWLALERMLLSAGERVAVLDADARRLGQFRGTKVAGRPALRVAGVLLNAAAVVGNDSGLTHLAGAMGVPTVALCGPTDGTKIFGAYPAVRVLNAPLPCRGCYWDPRVHGGDACRPRCPAMAAVRPEDVAAAVREVRRGRDG